MPPSGQSISCVTSHYFRSIRQIEVSVDRRQRGFFIESESDRSHFVGKKLNLDWSKFVASDPYRPPEDRSQEQQPAPELKLTHEEQDSLTARNAICCKSDKTVVGFSQIFDAGCLVDLAATRCTAVSGAATLSKVQAKADRPKRRSRSYLKVCAEKSFR